MIITASIAKQVALKATFKTAYDSFDDQSKEFLDNLLNAIYSTARNGAFKLFTPIPKSIDVIKLKDVLELLEFKTVYSTNQDLCNITIYWG